MNEQARGVFLCPDCGSPSTVTGEGEAACSECGKRFSIPEQVTKKVMPRAAKTSSGAIQRNIALKQKGMESSFGRIEQVEEPIDNQKDTGQVQRERGERRKRLKKRSKPPARVYLGWFFLWMATVAVVLFVVSRLQQQFGSSPIDALTIEARLIGEEKEFYRSEYPKVRRAFNGYLKARTVSMMSESAILTRQLERKMTHHTKENSFRRATSGLKPNPVFWNVAFEESPGFVEVVWDSGSDGFFEGVFVKEDNVWKLDWEQHVRYSNTNWTLFRQQVGSQRSGLFRVYVEKVSDGEDSDFNPWIKVRLLPPYADTNRQRLEATDEILLKGDNEIAGQIGQLFIDASGQSKGYSKLWQRDPDDFRRAFLRLEWVSDSVTGEESIMIKEVLAEHWRSLEIESQTRESGENKEATDDE